MLVGSDFDGTLSNIVADPAAAQLVSGAKEAIGRLLEAQPAGPHFEIVIVSGRGLADLRQRCAIAECWYLGSHGNEIAAPHNQPQKLTKINHDGFWKSSRPHALRELVDELERASRQWPGVFVEPKPWSVSLHYRNAANYEDDIVRFGNAFASQRNFRVLHGKYMLELIAPGAHTKGEAVVELRRRLRCDLGFYAGDDVTDEDVFRMGDPNLITIFVAPAKQEQQLDPRRGQQNSDKKAQHRASSSPTVETKRASASPTVETTSAMYWLPGPDAVVKFLQSLAGRRT